MSEKVSEKCNVCHSIDSQPLTGYECAHLRKCNTCSFVFSAVVPAKNELVDLYEKELHHATYLSPITVLRYEQILREFEPFRKTNRILDVGAGDGFFLEIAKKKGWTVIGTEISKHCIDVCRKKGIEMYPGELDEIHFDESSFDAVVCIEVIEHTDSPREMITEIHRILRPGGIAYVTTPNFNALLRYRFKIAYDVICYPIHLCYFTKKTLRKVFAENGFIAKKIRTTGYSITRKKTSKGKSNQDYVSETSDDEMLRYRIEKNGWLRNSKTMINFFLNLFGIGDSLKGHFVKR